MSVDSALPRDPGRRSRARRGTPELKGRERSRAIQISMATPNTTG
jgi:hypothetical protein